jgi:signal transduction histidine kinase/ActR/RegA family two-component response regulator/PAS domain-containing protein
VGLKTSHLDVSVTTLPPLAGSNTRAIFRAAAVIALAVVAVLLGCWLLYGREADQIARRETERETLRVALLSKLVESELRPVAQDLWLLADGDGLRNYLETGSPDALRAAIRRAKFLSARNSAYDQVRFIDASGQELLRVNGGGVLVEASGLQNKADRSYFLKASQLPAGVMLLSQFDLNVENGKLEEPAKPMLRFAAPVFDSAGRRRGIYVINYLGSNFIARLQQSIPTGMRRLRLLNSSGYWLKAEDPRREWGFMFPARKPFSLALQDPALWGRVQKLQNGQSIDGDHVFTWRRLSPAELLGVEPAQLQAGDDFLVIASEISPSEWSALFAGLRQMMFIVTAIVLVLTLTCLWFFRRWRAMVRVLRDTNQSLEQRVQARTAELAQSNQSLKDREELLEETGSLAKVGGWEFEPATGEGRWTSEIARIHGVDPSLEPNKQFGLQFYPGDSGIRIEAAVKKALADGTPYDLELEFISAQGEPKWVRTISHPVVEDGKVVRMRGALQDVTARKRAEIKLHSQLQRLSLLERITRAIGEKQDLASILQVAIGAVENELPADFSCLALYDAGAAALTVTALGAASHALAGTLGIGAQARIPIDANGLSRSVRGTLVYEPEITQIEAPFPQLLASGGLHSVVIAPLQIHGNVFGVLIAARRQAASFASGECEFLRQLSEHVALAAHQAQLHGSLQRAYEELRTTQQAVMQQERLRVLGQMASGIAHDINNAISPIMLYTDSLLENETNLSERTRGVLQTIQRAVSDVAETVARMREYYRQREPQTELTAVRPNELIHQVTELTRARWQTIPQQRGTVIDLRTNFANPLPEVLGIESEIREALTNLVFNGVDAMPEGGTLTLTTRAGENATVLIEVTDTGTGMDEETRLRCLEPFFTTKGERGTGLGLAMVYGIMQRHGGSIDIDSAPGSGTTMRLSFSQALSTAPAIHTANKQPPINLTILLIDDDPNVLKALAESLGLDGHTLMTAGSGERGIAMFREARRDRGANAISVVITDLGMPGMDGRQVAAAIKAESPDTPVILLTGWGERLLAEGSAPMHVDRVLSKPPRLTILRQTLSELLGTEDAS